MDNKDQAFLEYIIQHIVTKPEAVVITRTVDDLGVLITLTVDQEDMGRIIGKDGQTAKAIRTLLRVIGSRNNERVNMKILEPEGSEGPPAREETPAPEASEEAPAAEEKPAEEKPAEKKEAAEEKKETAYESEKDAAKEDKKSEE